LVLDNYDLDGDGQPKNKALNFGRNREKSAYALRGILHGVVADEQLNEMELLFLDTWLSTQKQLEDGDCVDLLDLISDILEDGIVTKNELEELRALINDVIQYGRQSADSVEGLVNELLGMLMGFVADNKLTDGEFVHLDNWLASNPSIATTWPAEVLISRIKEIKKDGIVDAEEKSDLLETLRRITGQRFDETGAADGAVAEVFSDTICKFEHLNKTICFTGKFVCGTREACEKLAENKGATVSRTVTSGLDVLILGTLASRDWRFTSHGRKIEKALKIKKKGSDILILSERAWLKCI
jgi:hypothetical protein